MRHCYFPSQCPFRAVQVLQTETRHLCRISENHVSADCSEMCRIDGWSYIGRPLSMNLPCGALGALSLATQLDAAEYKLTLH